ncbi:MAG: hypothetical protein IK092_03965 [Muribaculaceae bacterium]|nr:hypothetical protein [Muribaculaceae bacterium]
MCQRDGKDNCPVEPPRQITADGALGSFVGDINCMSDCLIFMAEHKNEVKLALDNEDYLNNVTQEIDFSHDDKLDEDILDADIDDWPFHDEIIIPKR